MEYSISGGLSYEKALELIEKLKEKGIEAYITAGGIAIYPVNNSEERMMFFVCKQKQFEIIPLRGMTTHQQDVMYMKQ